MQNDDKKGLSDLGGILKGPNANWGEEGRVIDPNLSQMGESVLASSSQDASTSGGSEPKIAKVDFSAPTEKAAFVVRGVGANPSKSRPRPQQTPSPALTVKNNSQVFSAKSKSSNQRPIYNTQEENKIFRQERLVVYGGFWRRLAASIWDLWPTQAFSLLAFLYVVLMGEGKIMGILVGIVGLLNIIYNIILYYKRGETIGYKLFGIRVVSGETGMMPSNLTLFLRWFYKFILLSFLGLISVFIGDESSAGIVLSIAGFVILIIAVSPIAFRKNKKALYDSMAKTLVISESLKKTWLVWVTNILILLLPVIGILSGGIMLFLNPVVQIDKAEYARDKNSLTGVSAAAAIYYDGNEFSYDGLCQDFSVIKIMSGIDSFNCNDNELGYGAEVKAQNGYYCLDSSGYRGQRDIALNGGVECAFNE